MKNIFNLKHSFRALSVLCLSIYSLIYSNNAFAVDPWYPNPFYLKTHIVNARPAALSEAFTAVADDQNALYYNPAGLALINTDNWSWFDYLNYIEIISPFVQIGSSSSFTVLNELYDDYQKAIKEDSGFPGNVFSKKTSWDKIVSILAKVNKGAYYLGAGINPYFVTKNLGIAMYNSLELELNVKLFSITANLELLSDNDIRVGYAHKFFGNKLSVGAALSGRVRLVSTEQISIDKIAIFKGNQSKIQEEVSKVSGAGYGVGLDAGILFTPIEIWSPTLGLAIINIGDLKFYNMKLKIGDYTLSSPKPLPQSVNLGLSLTPRFGNLFTRTSMDFHDINIPGPSTRKLRFGLEAGYVNRFSVQLGFSGEYPHGNLGEERESPYNPMPSFGFEFRFYLLNLRFATYVVERGYDSGQSPQRRYTLGGKILL